MFLIWKFATCFSSPTLQLVKSNFKTLWMTNNLWSMSHDCYILFVPPFQWHQFYNVTWTAPILDAAQRNQKFFCTPQYLMNKLRQWNNWWLFFCPVFQHYFFNKVIFYSEIWYHVKDLHQIHTNTFIKNKFLFSIEKNMIYS